MVTLRNLRLAVPQLYFIRTKCIHELCVFFITKKDYFPIQLQVNGFHNRGGVSFLHGMILIIKYQSRYCDKRGKSFWSVTPRTWQDGYEYFRGIPFTSIQMKAWMHGTGYC